MHLDFLLSINCYPHKFFEFQNDANNDFCIYAQSVLIKMVIGSFDCYILNFEFLETSSCHLLWNFLLSLSSLAGSEPYL